MSKLSGLGGRLYSGETSVDFIGQRRRWYSISAVFILASIAALIIQGLHLGIEFKGGSSYTVNKSGGEGGIGGLFFIFAGMLAVAIMTTKLVYNVQPSGKVAFLYSLRQSSLPLLAIIAVGGAISVIAFILIRTGILKN